MSAQLKPVSQTEQTIKPVPDTREKPLKVVFIEAAAEMGGVQYSTLFLLQRLNKNSWRPVVFCPSEGDLPTACRKLDVPVQILRNPKLHSTSIRVGKHLLPNPLAWAWDVGSLYVAARNLTQRLARENADIIVTKGMFSHFTGGLAAQQLGIPCVWHLQDFISERFLGVYRRVFGQMARWLPDHIIVDGAAIARQLPQQLQERTSIILNGVDTNVFCPADGAVDVRREFGIPPDALVVGNAARMTPWKGQHHLLEAFALIATEIPSACLLFVGSALFEGAAYERKLHERTAELSLSERVIFTGYRHDLPRLLTAMDIFAHTSVEKDTSPLALLSAMSAGLPVVAFDIEGSREVLTDGTEGLLVKVKDTGSLAEALYGLLTNKNHRRLLAHNARERAIRDFSLEKYALLTDETLRSVADPLLRYERTQN